MLKRILTFCLALWLTACAGARIKQGPTDVRTHKKVNFFTQGHNQAAFKVVGQMNDDYLDGVLRIKKIGEEDFDVVLMVGAGYRVMQATVAPEGVAYRYLFKEADTSLVRGRVSQFLNLLVSDPGTYKSRHQKGETVTLTYAGKDAKTRLKYRAGEIYPFAAQTLTLLNTADLSYAEYAPATADGGDEVPHQLVYKDGSITLELTLISLR